MAQMYFSKFNINSEIYNVYNNLDLENKILDEVLQKINSEQIYTEQCKEDEEEKEYQYKFCDLIKDFENRIVTGRLVKIYDGETESFDWDKDTVEITYTEDKAASCTFCFDLKTEEIAFITRQGMKYRQFNKYFKILVEQNFREDAFEIFLENNIGLLEEKVKKMSRILSISATIIPPNASTADFDILFGATNEEIKDSGATKYHQGIEVSPRGNRTLKIENNSLVNRMFYAVAKGYGELVAKGRDHFNTRVTVSSDEDAPYVLPIPENEKDSLPAFKERAIAGISQLMSEKTQRKLRGIGDLNEGEEN